MAQLNLNNRSQVLSAEAVENDDLIDPVEELRPEVSLEQAVDGFAGSVLPLAHP